MRDGKNLVAGVVDRIRQQLMIRAGSERPDLEILLALRHGIAVKQNFFGGVAAIHVSGSKFDTACPLPCACNKSNRRV